MDEVNCKGSEKSFVDCPHVTKDDCNKNEGAGVRCHAGAGTERKGYLRSNN